MISTPGYEAYEVDLRVYDATRYRRPYHSLRINCLMDISLPIIDRGRRFFIYHGHNTITVTPMSVIELLCKSFPLYLSYIGHFDLIYY